MDWEEALVFAAVFPVSAMTGIAVYLRSQRPITAGAIIGQAMYHGLMGVAILMVSWDWRESAGLSVWTPLGLAVLAGLANVTAIDALRWFMNRMGVGNKNGSSE